MADITDCTPDDDCDDERIQRGTEFACGLQEVRNKAKENLSAAQGQQKKRYDIKHAPPTYKVGEKFSNTTVVAIPAWAISCNRDTRGRFRSSKFWAVACTDYRTGR